MMHFVCLQKYVYEDLRTKLDDSKGWTAEQTSLRELRKSFQARVSSRILYLLAMLRVAVFVLLGGRALVKSSF